MNPSTTAREAKEFLVSKIVEEAQREGIPLSELERKMLYFSETYWTLPDMMNIAEEFDSKYDQNEYEKKITALAKSAVQRWRKESSPEYEMWQSAIRVLQKEDHYILVMASPKNLRSGTRMSPWFKGLLALLIVFFALMKLMADSPHLPVAVGIWFLVACTMLVYKVLSVILRAMRKRTKSRAQ